MTTETLRINSCKISLQEIFEKAEKHFGGNLCGKRLYILPHQGGISDNYLTVKHLADGELKDFKRESEKIGNKLRFQVSATWEALFNAGHKEFNAAPEHMMVMPVILEGLNPCIYLTTE